MAFDLGPHAGYIIASYAVTIIVVAALVASIRVDHRVQTRRLAELEAKGGRRRSAARGPAPGSTAAAPSPEPPASTARLQAGEPRR